MFLIDSQKNILAKIKIHEIKDNLCICNLIDDHLPDHIREVFLQYEEIINNQMFSFLDEIENRINDFNLAIYQEDNPKPLKISDLQMMSNGKISFQISKVDFKMLYQDITLKNHPSI